MKNTKHAIILNTYKLSMNHFISKIGFDLYHTAIEYDGIEYAFGYLDSQQSGIYEIIPMTFEDGNFMESLILGYCRKDSFEAILAKIKKEYLGNSYNILTKNCNHFTDDLCKRILHKGIPKKFTLGLKLGEFLRKIF